MSSRERRSLCLILALALPAPWATLGEVPESFLVDSSASAACAPSDTAMCLNDSRFRVEATYLTLDGRTGPAHMVPITSDAGTMWFFGSTNVEAVVKVLDACSAGQYWVFAGGLTNVDVQLTVTDTVTSAVRSYHNPQSTPFQPIQDTSAFVCLGF